MALAEGIRGANVLIIPHEVSSQVRYGLDLAKGAVFKDPITIEQARQEARKRGPISGAITTIFTFNSER